MIFSRDSIDAIVNGPKTQTRRIVKPNELGDLNLGKGETYSAVHSTHDDDSRLRLKWRVGDTYAVQPGRGKPGVWWTPITGLWVTINGSAYESEYREFWQPLRIKLLKIRREPLQAISETDAVAEGYPAKWPAPTMAAVNYGAITMFKFPQDDPITWYRKLWGSINGPKSWDTTGDVWRLSFEVVR